MNNSYLSVSSDYHCVYSWYNNSIYSYEVLITHRYNKCFSNLSKPQLIANQVYPSHQPYPTTPQTSPTLPCTVAQPFQSTLDLHCLAMPSQSTPVK